MTKFAGKQNRWNIEDVIFLLRDLAQDGCAPHQHTYDAHRGSLISARTIERSGCSWKALAAMAGLRPACRVVVGTQHTARDERLRAEMQRMAAAAEPVRPSTWPLFGIPTRTEVQHHVLPDGSVLRTTKQYYSLR